jgi:carbon dioxide concentrating mechanism protein CcmL
MRLGKVTGTVVSTKTNLGAELAVCLLVNTCDQHGNLKNDFVVAVDLVGAGRGEMVLLTEGSPSRETPATVNKPVDALIVGIVDVIDEHDHIVFKK